MEMDDCRMSMVMTVGNFMDGYALYIGKSTSKLEGYRSQLELPDLAISLGGHSFDPDKQHIGSNSTY
jgi:hypothetical protein